MSVLMKKTEFYKRKSNCEAIVIAAWGLEQRPGGVSGEQHLPYYTEITSQVFNGLKTYAIRN